MTVLTPHWTEWILKIFYSAVPQVHAYIIGVRVFHFFNVSIGLVGADQSLTINVGIWNLKIIVGAMYISEETSNEKANTE